MEMMLTFITDDFFQSPWTNQEIGVAFGRNIPIIPLKMQDTNPTGLISKLQALRGDIEKPTAHADKIYDLVKKHLNQDERIKQAAIEAFVNSPNDLEVKKRFTRLEIIKNINDSEINYIIEQYNEKEILKKAYFLEGGKKLIDFLNKKTEESGIEKSYEMNGEKIKECEYEIPF